MNDLQLDDPLQDLPAEVPLKGLRQDIAAFLRATSPTIEDPSSRKRGGQPGNQNARKYFFYAPAVEADQDDAVDDAMEIRDFSQELALVRVRLLALLRNPNANPDHVIKLFNLLCKVMVIQMKYRSGR